MIFSTIIQIESYEVILGVILIISFKLTIAMRQIHIIDLLPQRLIRRNHQILPRERLWLYKPLLMHSRVHHHIKRLTQHVFQDLVHPLRTYRGGRDYEGGAGWAGGFGHVTVWAEEVAAERVAQVVGDAVGVLPEGAFLALHHALV